MFDMFKLIADASTEIFQEKLDDRAKKAQVAEKLMIWLTNDARKKPDIPDLPKRLDDMRKKTTKMVEDMEIKFDGGKLVVKVTGSSENTWRMYRLGSDWFEPDEDAVERVLSGLFTETSS